MDEAVRGLLGNPGFSIQHEQLTHLYEHETHVCTIHHRDKYITFEHPFRQYALREFSGPLRQFLEESQRNGYELGLD